jgi:post-segregation antitoxin (ccd killing protein)
MPKTKAEAVEEVRQTTSIKMTPSVWKEFKKLAIDRDKDVSELLEEMIKKELETERKKHVQ